MYFCPYMTRIRALFSKEAFEVIKVRDFRLFLFYRFFMTSATLMQSVIVGWQLYDLTKSVLALGMIGLAEVIPQVSIALFAGHFVDLYDRKKIIAITTFLLLIGSAILAVYSISSLNAYILFGTMPIYVTIFLTGLVRGILMPAHTAFLGQTVSRKQLPRAATWNSIAWHIAAVLGPALGGMIYGFVGIVPAYSTVFIFFLIGIILIRFTNSPNQFTVKKGESGMFERIREGIDYVFKQQILLGAFALDMFAVLFGGAVAMLPVFASEVLRIGPQGLGILRACPATGAILMSIFLTFRPPSGKAGYFLMASVTGFGLCIIAFALSINFYLSAAILILSGLFDNVSVVIRSTILQVYTPDEMRGRVAAVNSIFVGSSNELGAFESGVAARLLGLIPSVIFGGCMTLLVTFVATVKAPKLRELSLKESELEL
jgi:MFS family permease